MQFGSKDWNRERPGGLDHYSGQVRARPRSYSPNEARSGGGARFSASESCRPSSNLSWSTSHQWDSSKDHEPRVRTYDYMHRSTYTGISTKLSASPPVARPYGSSDWSPEKTVTNVQSSYPNRFGEDNFSEPVDVPGSSPAHSAQYWSTSSFARQTEQFDYNNDRNFSSPPTLLHDMRNQECHRADEEQLPTLVHPTVSNTNLAPSFDVLELANKITSLGPLIRDPRLLTRILKIAKPEEHLTSPKREEIYPFSNSSVPNPADLQWSKPSEYLETQDQSSRQSKLTEYSQKYKIVKKSHPPPTIPANPNANNASGVLLELGDNNTVLDGKLDTSFDKDVVNGNTSTAEMGATNSDKVRSNDNNHADVPMVPPFASKAQLLVKESFIKRKQEGRAKMSTPACKTDCKQNQALLKLVVGSKDDSESVDNTVPTSQTALALNAMVKLPGLKNILNSVMKTSISQVLRKSIDSPKSETKEIKKSKSKEKINDDNCQISVKDDSKDVDVKIDSSVEPQSNGVEDNIETSKPKVNRARKSQNVSEKSQNLIPQQTMVVTRKQAAMTTVSKNKKKKIKKRHFRGGTYKLYLSTTKKKKKGKEMSQDDELSVEGTETTGSVADSDDETSDASEDITTSDQSFQGDDTTPTKTTSSEQSTPEDKLDKTLGENRRSGFVSKFNEKLDEQEINGSVSEIKKIGTEELGKDTKNEVDDVVDNSTSSSKLKSSKHTDIGNLNNCERDSKDSAAKQNCEVDVTLNNSIKHDQNQNDTKESCDGTERVPQSPDHSDTVCSSAESHSLSDGEINKENTPFVSPKQLHSIASSVKTRQRVKRRQSDDLLLTPSELQAINSLDSTFKRPKRVQTNGLSLSPSPLPSVPTHHVTNLSKIANACLPKLDVIYNHKKLKHNACTCQAKAVVAKNENGSKSKIYCQAVDSVDEKLIGCCNLVAKHQLVRPSMKIPFTAMCEVHVWRLRHHHCCPICGVFCSQGSFMQCTSPIKGKPQIHLFHKCCLLSNEDLSVDQCPHCTASDKLKTVLLELNTPSAPTFYLSQKPLFSEPRAKITINRLSDEEKTSPEDLATIKYAIPDTEKVLSAAGLPVGPERSQLDKLLEELNVEGMEKAKLNHKDLWQVAKEGNLEETLRILALGIDPNMKDDDLKDLPLHVACLNGHLPIAHLLIQAGASVDSLDDHLYTPLMVAVENQQLEIAQYLVKCGTHLLAKGEDGMTCLHLAARCGNVAICKMLLDSGRITPNVQDDGGWTPTVWAAEHSHVDVVRLLVERGCDCNMIDNEQNIALHWSAFSGNVDISHLFLEMGSDLTAKNEHGDTPLHIAARQNKYACVVLFLARGADIDVVNKENETPLMCCIDTESQTYMALLMNKELKKFGRKKNQKAERVIHSDISKGKELNSIQCVNGVDDEGVPSDYMYVIENCETSTISLDRTITSLQSCRCEDDCTSPNCTCSTLSFKCWFDNDGRLLPEFNLSDPPMIFECNRACLCWKNCNNRALQHGILCRLQLFRTRNKGWGVRTLKNIPMGTFICEYIGEIITDGEADQREDDSYLFDLDNRDGETYCLDARYYGNVSRFVNHQCDPNLVPVKVFVDHQDLSFPRIAFFSSRDIFAGEELGFDYGEKFWVIKYKSFTCDCESSNCKYSADTIHQTLESYYKRLKEEHAEEGIDGQQDAATNVQIQR